MTKLEKLWKVCEEWRDKYQPLCGESMMQCDDIMMATPELAESIMDIIGYYEDNEA